MKALGRKLAIGCPFRRCHQGDSTEARRERFEFCAWNKTKNSFFVKIMRGEHQKNESSFGLRCQPNVLF